MFLRERGCISSSSHSSSCVSCWRGLWHSNLAQLYASMYVHTRVRYTHAQIWRVGHVLVTVSPLLAVALASTCTYLSTYSMCQCVGYLQHCLVVARSSVGKESKKGVDLLPTEGGCAYTLYVYHFSITLFLLLALLAYTTTTTTTILYTRALLFCIHEYGYTVYTLMLYIHY